MDLESIEKGVELILTGIFEDISILSDENFRDTPKRVARAYQELCKGINNPPNILSVSFPGKGYDSMIFSKDITVYSLCPHHLLPVKYNLAIGYIPSENGRVVGASKLTRVAENLAAAPILQEELTKRIADYFEQIEPKGIAVVVSGEHDCMRIRGVKQQNATFETSEMRGLFRESLSVKTEFFELMKLSK